MSDSQVYAETCPVIATVLSEGGLVAVAEYKPNLGLALEPGHHGRDCQILTDLTERTVGFEFIGTPFPNVMEKVGDAVTFRDDLYDPEGNVVGHAIGYSTIVEKREDGHLIGIYQEAVELPQGTIQTNGAIDRTAMLDGGWARFEAIGTGGIFAGLQGIRQWRLVPPLYNPPRPTQHAEVRIALCAGVTA